MPHRNQLPGPLGELANCHAHSVRLAPAAFVVELPRIMTANPMWTLDDELFRLRNRIVPLKHCLPRRIISTECLGDLLTSWPISSIKFSGLAPKADFLRESWASDICDDHGLPLLEYLSPFVDSLYDLLCALRSRVMLNRRVPVIFDWCRHGVAQLKGRSVQCLAERGETPTTPADSFRESMPQGHCHASDARHTK
jgi:hypothetical protein